MRVRRARGAGLTHWKTVCVILLPCGATAVAKTKAVYATLLDFTGPNGFYPTALVQGTDGNLYGSAFGSVAGPPHHHTYTGGIIYKITPAGEQTILYTFCSQANCPDGDGPNPLILATDGNFYGTTFGGGANGGGTIFKITPAGALTTLYSFCGQLLATCADGSEPSSSLVQGTDGNFYGITGTIDLNGSGSNGTIYKITPRGKFTTLYTFCTQLNCNGGNYPTAGLILATDGNLYGTTGGGGANTEGTIFKITPQGKLTTLYTFCSLPNCIDGSHPATGVIQATDGNFYGTTGEGALYRITPTGTMTTLCDSGLVDPRAMLVQANDGIFYGAGYIIFSITPGCTLTTFHHFGGSAPVDLALFQATSGVFYGPTYFGGPAALGTIYSEAVGLGPFVETVQNSGKTGQTIMILGQGFTGTTSVSFNGSSASYTIVSDTYMKAKIPTAAATGPITVATPGGTLTSSKPFVVKP